MCFLWCLLSLLPQPSSLSVGFPSLPWPGTCTWMRVGFPQIAVAFPGFALQACLGGGADAGASAGIRAWSNGGAPLIL